MHRRGRHALLLPSEQAKVVKLATAIGHSHNNAVVVLQLKASHVLYTKLYTNRLHSEEPSMQDVMVVKQRAFQQLVIFTHLYHVPLLKFIKDLKTLGPANAHDRLTPLQSQYGQPVTE